MGNELGTFSHLCIVLVEQFPFVNTFQACCFLIDRNEEFFDFELQAQGWVLVARERCSFPMLVFRGLGY